MVPLLPIISYIIINVSPRFIQTAFDFTLWSFSLPEPHLEQRASFSHHASFGPSCLLLGWPWRHWEVWSGFCRIATYWNWPAPFRIRLGLWAFSEKGHRAKVSLSSHHVKGTYMSTRHRYERWPGSVEGVLVRFLHCETGLPPPHFPYHPLWKEAAMHSPHLKQWRV